MKPKQSYYVFILLCVIAFLSIIGAFYWGSSRLSANSRAIAGLMADRDVGLEKISKLAGSKLTEEELAEVTSLLDQQLPRKKEQDRLIADIIYTATAEAGIPFSNVTSFSFKGAAADPSELSGTEKFKEVPSVNEYPFDLQIEEVSYDTVLDLLSRIETNSRIVQVSNIQITPDPENPDSLTTIISMKAFLQP